MKNFIRYLIVIIYLMCASQSYALQNSIIAKVGNEIITNLDLKNEINVFLILTGKKVDQQNVNAAKDSALKALIRNALKRSEIKRLDIKNYNDQEVENYIQRISQNIGVEPRNLKDFFLKNNIDYDMFLNNYINELKWNTLIFRIYKNQISINPVEVENELKKKLLNQENLKSYKISEIEIPINQKTEQTLQEIYSNTDNESFVNFVKKYSISSSKDNKGDLGWFDEEALSEVYIKELKKVKKNALTKPIRTINSFVIIKLTDFRETEKNNSNVNKIKENIIIRKKEENLKLFSRSHFSGVEANVLIDIK